MHGHDASPIRGCAGAVAASTSVVWAPTAAWASLLGVPGGSSWSVVDPDGSGGYVFDIGQSYATVFYLFGAFSLFSFILVVLLEWKEKSRRFDYEALI